MTAPAAVRIVGSYLSPYVRKVLVALDWKGVPYEIDPIVPFFGDERFSQAEPDPAHPGADRRSRHAPRLLGHLPVPRGALSRARALPADVAQRAHARWLEEYADSRMGEVFIWGLFNQVAINPFVWGKPTDPEVVERVRTQDIPHVLDYLESRGAGRRLSLRRSSRSPTSRSPASSATRRSRATRSTARAGRARRRGSSARSRCPSFAKLEPFEQKSARTPIPKQREALAAIGAPLTDESWGNHDAAPRHDEDLSGGSARWHAQRRTNTSGSEKASSGRAR